jgi:NADH pyrophosphatase NudC (nudix superfamily)
MTLDPHMALLIASTAGVGLLMSLAGLQKSALEWRRRHRICPSCGHRLLGRACGCTRRSL